MEAIRPCNKSGLDFANLAASLGNVIWADMDEESEVVNRENLTVQEP